MVKQPNANAKESSQKSNEGTPKPKKNTAGKPRAKQPGRRTAAGRNTAPAGKKAETKVMTIEEQLKALRSQAPAPEAPAGTPAVQPAEQRPAAQPRQKREAKQPARAPKRQPAKNGKAAPAAPARPKQDAKAGTPKKTAAAKPANRRTANDNAKRTGRVTRKTPLRIIPLGGLREIGKNMTIYECGQDMFIVDCGMGFPDADMLGVDLVIPDFSFIEKNKDKIRGIVITHGHEDHIGSIPYFLKKFNVPIYGTKLAIGLIQGKLKEHGLLGKANLNVIAPKQTIKMGCMAVEFIRVNHSIPDCVAVAIHTPAGVVIYTGDFKVDYTPIEGEIIDLTRFAELGNKGVLCLLSDSTNAERPGYTQSERSVGQSFNTLFNQAEGKRIIVATFSSNIHRIQQIVNYAVKYGRKVAVSGRSMINVVGVAMELGYLHVPEGVFIDIDAVNRYPADEIVLITTGSQGEPLSALSRMAHSEHNKVSITSHDFIIISATPIPGNEKHVTRVVNDLSKLGAKVISEKMYEVHVSGHACQEELKLILSLTRPKYFIPAHGEYKHLMAHAALAQAVGVPESNIVIGDIGQVIQLDNVDIKVVNTIEAGGVFVDGLGVGDVGSIVIRDRKRLAQDGLIIIVATMQKKTGTCIAGPDIVSRGFVYVRESEQLMEDARKVVRKALDKCVEDNVHDWTTIKLNVRDALSSFIYRKTKRSPMILPIIMEV